MSLFCLQKVDVIMNHAVGDFPQWNIFSLILALAHFPKILQTGIKTADAYFGLIFTYKFSTHVVMLLKYLKEHFVFLVQSEELPFNLHWINKFAFFLHFPMNFKQAKFYRFKIAVNLYRCGILARTTFFRLIPKVGFYITFKLHFN